MLAALACVFVMTVPPGPMDVLGPDQALVIDRTGWIFNWAAFDQDKLVSFNGYQYTPYWDADEVLVVVRRNLADNTVQALRLPQYTLTINPKDGHRNTVAGISPEDGRLHLSWDHHNNDLRYTKSRAGFLHSPPEQVTPEDFEPAQPLLPGAPQRVTYPRFFNDPEENLFFLYRTGGSGAGDTVLTRYDAATATWGMVSVRLFGKAGVYPPWDNSPSRNAYPHDILFDHAGRLHATWVFREESKTWASNHDLHYVYSDDHGVTWRNNGGTRVADLPADDPVLIDDPGIVVWDIPVYSWVINTGAMAVDAQNRLHVATFHLLEPAVPEKLEHSPPPEIHQRLGFFHYWRGGDGTWHRGGPLEVPRRAEERIRRPNVVAAPGGAVVVYWATSRGFRCHVAFAEDRWERWATFLMTGPEFTAPDACKHDRRLLRERGVLSFACDPNGGQDGRGFAVLDFSVERLVTAARAQLGLK